MTTPISEKFLGESDLFGLEFQDGFVFLEIREWEQVQYNPHTNVGSVGTQSSSGFSRLQEPDDSDDILFIDSGQLKVIHAAIGQMRSDIRRYTRYPEGGPLSRSIPNLNGADFRNGDDYSYVDGGDSPYEEPTDAEELVIPPDTRVSFTFYNSDDTDAHTPVLNILMRVYRIRPLDPDVSSDRNAIRRIVKPGSAPPVYPVGSMTNKVTYDLRSDWGVNTLSSSEVRSIRRQS